MRTIDIIERIEGEARLKLEWKNNIISNASVEFLNFRGFEYILEGKEVLDALIYTPRICGICGQAHLMATSKALENIYKNAGEELEISKKAKNLRQVALNIEIIDSHIKWFYMFIMPDITKLSSKEFNDYKALKGSKWLKAQKASSEIIKALALIAGQWPHSSFSLPGGVMCDPTLFDISLIKSYFSSCIKYFEKEISGISIDKFLSFSKVKDLDVLDKDLKDFISLSFELNLHNIGKSYDNHICLSQTNTFKKARIINKKNKSINLLKVKESEDFTFEVNKKKKAAYSWSKTVEYENDFYETGPLSRALISKNKFITSLHKEYKDSSFTRIFARINEIAILLDSSLTLINEIDINEESFIKPKIKLRDFDNISSISTIEAARGSLLHEIEIKNGIIHKYNVITPTVWNLGPGTNNRLGIVQKAIVGSNSKELAQIVLRSFDVCSVCTTH